MAGSEIVEGRLQTFGSVVWLSALSRNADSCLRVRLCSASTRCLSDCASANFAWWGDTSYRNNCLIYAEMDLLRLLYTYIRAISEAFLFYGFLLYFNHTWNKTTVITYVPIKNVAEVAPARGSRWRHLGSHTVVVLPRLDSGVDSSRKSSRVDLNWVDFTDFWLQLGLGPGRLKSCQVGNTINVGLPLEISYIPCPICINSIYICIWKPPIVIKIQFKIASMVHWMAINSYNAAKNRR